ncbi:MAG: T9SS type A sorting domain-containing protein [Ignavibacteria bacterium]|nr:T9SS type A sorting domain-containing protein [Ignavibacteria bacterium]
MKRITIFLIALTFNAFSQSVVINKFYNSGNSSGVDDAVELLVIEKDLNMSGMILKDFSSSMNNDNGGKYLFKDVELWQKVPAGTLIIIRVNSLSNDLDTSDFVLNVGLKDTAYFQQLGTGTFDLATTELVMIKAAGSDISGVDGCIHAFGSGTAGTFFNLAPEPKLRSTGTTGTGKFAFAKNSNSLLSDFNGTDADTSSSLVLGEPNNQSNSLFINLLRSGQTQVEKNTLNIKNFYLYDNYPNPFNPSTNIKFYLNKDSNIELSIYSLNGNKIHILLNDFYKAGTYEINFDGSNLSSGVYFYKLKTDFGSSIKKMILIK